MFETPTNIWSQPETTSKPFLCTHGQKKPLSICFHLFKSPQQNLSRFFQLSCRQHLNPAQPQSKAKQGYPPALHVHFWKAATDKRHQSCPPLSALATRHSSYPLRRRRTHQTHTKVQRKIFKRKKPTKKTSGTKSRCVKRKENKRRRKIDKRGKKSCRETT